MDHGFTTSWDELRRAAAGIDSDRDRFARRYAAIIRSYLRARWHDTVHAGETDDAVQEVFCECFRQGGILDRADPERSGGFRAFLFGAIRNVARRFEAKRSREQGHGVPSIDPDVLAAREESLSQLLDREWGRAMLQAAAERMRAQATTGEAERRVELLRLRFAEGLPIRTIAQRWNVDPEHLHREHSRAKAEFRDALGQVVALHDPNLTPGEVDRECRSLLHLFARRVASPSAPQPAAESGGESAGRRE